MVRPELSSGPPLHKTYGQEVTTQYALQTAAHRELLLTVLLKELAVVNTTGKSVIV